MILLQIKITGGCYSWEQLDYGYIEKTTYYENRIFNSYYLFGWFLFHRELIFRESVPAFAVLQRASLGSTDWKSKAPDLVDSSNKKEIIKTYTL